MVEAVEGERNYEEEGEPEEEDVAELPSSFVEQPAACCVGGGGRGRRKG